jgi:glucose/arabinose dehydrogenase
VVLLAALADAGGGGAPPAGRGQSPHATTRRPATTPAAPRCTSGGDCGPFVGWKGQVPGRTHLIRPADLPAPDKDEGADDPPRLVPRPPGALPKAPVGFKVQLFAEGLANPRALRVAPNGDVFVADSASNAVRVLRGLTKDGRSESVATFATGLNQPFGLAFYPPSAATPRWLYVGNTDQVVRFEYASGDLAARGAPKVIVPDLPSGGRLRGGGHWTRDLAFSLDGKKMFVAVGSHSNVDDPDNHPIERHRADVLEYTPDGTGLRVFASGIRNAVGLAVQPRTGTLWASVNERDRLGNDLAPDYITRVEEGGFYGWPWFYIGGNQDPRHAGKHPELREKVIVPDVLVQPHFASLQLCFYEGAQFPAEYKGDIFAAEHGSWNRRPRTGYEVIRVPLHGQDRAAGEYEDFLTGFVTDSGEVWGRPVGVAVAADGALLVSDDGSGAIWRVTYIGSAASSAK